MSFFPGSSDVTIDRSYISEIGGDFNINLMTQEPVAFLAQFLGKRKERDNSDFHAPDGLRKRPRCSTNSDGFKIVKTDEFELRTELISRSNYRVHSASYGTQGRVLAVKLFEGPHAKQDWTKNITFLKKSLHSNMPKIVGVSDESSEVPFVVFHGISEKKLQSLIAKALRTDLNKSVELSMKAVKGLAAGLNYIHSQGISGALIDVHGWENFDIFAGDNGEPIIAVHTPSTSCEDSSASHSSAVQSDDHGIEALNGLCQKLFSEVNSILYYDSPQREWDAYYDETIPTASIGEASDGTESISESAATATPTPSNSTKKPELNRTPRREVQWRFGMGASNRNLASIARRFGEYLDCFLSSSSDPPLRRIKASKEAYSGLWTSHRCTGYLREEITLTTDVARSAIISHEYPSQSEVCSLCGQLVLYQMPQLELQPQPDFQHTSSQVLVDHEIMQRRLQILLGLDDNNLGNMSISEKTSILHAFRSSPPMTVPMREPQTTSHRQLPQLHHVGSSRFELDKYQVHPALISYLSEEPARDIALRNVAPPAEDDGGRFFMSQFEGQTSSYLGPQPTNLVDRKEYGRREGIPLGMADFNSNFGMDPLGSGRYFNTSQVQERPVRSGGYLSSNLPLSAGVLGGYPTPTYGYGNNASSVNMGLPVNIGGGDDIQTYTGMNVMDPAGLDWSPESGISMDGAWLSFLRECGIMDVTEDR